MYQTILFDLDGTLTDPKEGITKCFQHALSCLGIEETDMSRLMRVIGPPLIDSFKDFYGMDEERAKLAVEKYRERFAEIGIFENAVYPGVKEMLSELKQAGKTIALATSKPQVFAIRILENYELAPYFDVAVGAELSGERNYKHEVIQTVFDKLQITDKSQVVMVGDRRQDIEGAKKCGIDSIGVKFGYAEDGELEQAGATYLIDSVQELRNFLLGDN